MVQQNIIEEIRDANHDWVDRVQHEVHDFQYDYDADVLYVAYGDPGEAFSMPLDVEGEDVYLRVELDTHRIVGMDFLHFRKVFLKNHEDLGMIYDSLSGILGKLDWRLQLRLPSDGGYGEVALMVPGHALLDYFPAYLPRVAPELVTAPLLPDGLLYPGVLLHRDITAG